MGPVDRGLFAFFKEQTLECVLSLRYRIDDMREMEEGINKKVKILRPERLDPQKQGFLLNSNNRKDTFSILRNRKGVESGCQCREVYDLVIGGE